MKEFKYIEFQRKRDFGDKLNATFSFVGQNFKSLIRSVLYIGGPPTLIASLLIGSFYADFMGLSLRRDPESASAYFSSPGFWMEIVFGLIFLIVGAVLLLSTTYNYIILYREKRSNQIEVHEVWDRVRQTLGMYVVTIALFALVAIVAYVLLLVPVFVLGAISPFLVFFGVLFLIIAIFYVYVSSSLVFVIRAMEKRSFFSSIARSFTLTRGKWWSTFGNIFVLSLMVSIFSMVFFIPGYVIMVAQALHDINPESFSSSGGGMGGLMTALMTLYYLSQFILSVLPAIGLAFQYYNLVELKEARGLMGEIETLGKPPETPQHAEDY